MNNERYNQGVGNTPSKSLFQFVILGYKLPKTKVKNPLEGRVGFEPTYRRLTVYCVTTTLPTHSYQFFIVYQGYKKLDKKTLKDYINIININGFLRTNPIVIENPLNSNTCFLQSNNLPFSRPIKRLCIPFYFLFLGSNTLIH